MPGILISGILLGRRTETSVDESSLRSRKKFSLTHVQSPSSCPYVVRTSLLCDTLRKRQTENQSTRLYSTVYIVYMNDSLTGRAVHGATENTSLLRGHSSRHSDGAVAEPTFDRKQGDLRFVARPRRMVSTFINQQDVIIIYRTAATVA